MPGHQGPPSAVGPTPTLTSCPGRVTLTASECAPTQPEPRPPETISVNEMPAWPTRPLRAWGVNANRSTDVGWPVAGETVSGRELSGPPGLVREVVVVAVLEPVVG